MARNRCLREPHILSGDRGVPPVHNHNGGVRAWLERVIGLGLGVFDLAIIDEAHKGRRTEGGLSRLINNVVALSTNARRLALTATPVELYIVQWQGTLSRIGLTKATLEVIDDFIVRYADAVTRVRRTWRSSEEARELYRVAAEHFQRELTPYLLRRDKREDPSVQRFSAYTGCPLNEYRREEEVCVEPGDLTPAWRQAVCAAEALSVVVRVRLAEDPAAQAEDRVAQRLRLTLANGHGISVLLINLSETTSTIKSRRTTTPMGWTARRPLRLSRPNKIQSGKNERSGGWR